MGASQLACYGVLLRIPFRLLLVLFWKAQARPTQVLPSRRGLSAERLVVIVVLLVFSDASRCGACLLDVDTASTALSFQNVAELTIPGIRFPLSGKEGEFVAVLDSCNPTHFFHVRSSDYSHGSAVVCIVIAIDLSASLQIDAQVHLNLGRAGEHMPIAALSLVDLWKVSSSRGRLSTGSHPRCKNRFSRVGVYGVNGDLRRGGLRGVFRADLALLGCCFFAFRGIITAEEKDQNSEGRMPPVLHLRHCWHDKHAVGFFISQERRVLNLKIHVCSICRGLGQ